MTKHQEIELLTKLKSETYFADYFKEDLSIMIENVMNDFPIEHGCSFADNEEETKLLARLAQQREEFKEKGRDLIESIFAECAPEDFSTDLIKKMAEMAGGRLEFIKCKRRAEREVNVSDIDYLIRKIEANEE